LNTGGSSDLSAKFEAPTRNVSLQYQAAPDTMPYLASRRGYKSGGFNDVNDAGAQKFGPEPIAIITDVADGIVQGADIEATIIPTPHIGLSGFYSYTDPLSAFCDHATKKTYLSLVLNSWTLGQDTGQYGPPRMFGVSAQWHFGHY
jgi:outer membrane receptor protein involved in Fe transport